MEKYIEMGHNFLNSKGAFKAGWVSRPQQRVDGRGPDTQNSLHAHFKIRMLRKVKTAIGLVARLG